MKRKWVLVSAIGVLLAVVLSAVRVWQPSEQSAEAKQERLSLQSTDDLTSLQGDAREDNPEQLYSYYQWWVETYRPSEEQKTKIYTMLQNGADEKNLISVCIFWEDTNDSFDLVQRIWEQRPEESMMTELSDPYVWIEGAYDHMTVRGTEALTTEEIKQYQSEGISLSDIFVANRLSRNTDFHIKDVLSERLDGNSWYEIIIGDGAASEYAMQNLAAEIDGNEILDSIIISRKTGVKAETILSAADGDRGVLESFREQYKQEKRNMEAEAMEE